MTWDVERQLRRTTCSFIEDLAALVEIPDAPSVAAQLFVQRFYVLHSFHTHDRFLVATAALFLAAKTEEFPIKVRLLTECALYLLLCRQPGKDELLKKSRSRQHSPHASHASHGHTHTHTHASHATQTHGQQHHHHHQQHQQRQQPQPLERSARGLSGDHTNRRSTSAGAKKSAAVRTDSAGKAVEMSASLGNDPAAAHAKHIACLHALLEVVDVGQVETTAAKVLLLERVVLQTLAFDVCVPQPFAYVAPCMARVFALEAVHPSVPYSDIRSLAFLLLADAVKTGLCLAFSALELAAGAVYLACLYRQSLSRHVATETNAPWWSVLGLSEQELEDVSRGFLWMYEDASGAKLTGLSAELQSLWSAYRPAQNLPDLEYVKALDAALQSSQ